MYTGSVSQQVGRRGVYLGSGGESRHQRQLMWTGRKT